MIPKILHCVWLSGEEKPILYANCLKSWQEKMPDYEIKEWSLDKLPKAVVEHPFVKGALESRKWAYATDYIRLWLLRNFGGIYMDLDVMVFKSFDPFMNHRFFSSIEFESEAFKKSVTKKEIIGVGIDAAIMGAEKGHPFIAEVLHYYDDLKFINKPEYHFKYIMPRVLTRVAKEKFGFRQLPNYQILKDDMHLYPCDVFSAIFNWGDIGCKSIDDAKNILDNSPIRHAIHLCGHSWYEGTFTPDWKWKVKHLLYILSGMKYLKNDSQD